MGHYVSSGGRVPVSDFAPIVRIPPKSDNPSGAGTPCRRLHVVSQPGLLCSRSVSMIVTLDGPGGTGKSTVSRVVAQRAGLPHLDTGAFYRAATLAVIDAGVDPSDREAVAEVVRGVTMNQESGRMYLNGGDVTREIRGEGVTAKVSAVSAHPEVRRLLVELQRAWIDEHGGGVVEGRDIGSVVFPDAAVKVFLNASPEVRAMRRAMETGEELGDVLADLDRRDQLDSTRAASPLTVPDGAVTIDTSELTFEEVVDQLLELIRAKS